MDNKRSIIFLSINYIGIFSLIGVGSVVTKDVPLYTTIAGNSIILIRIQFKNAILIKLEVTRWLYLTKNLFVPEILRLNKILNG